MLFSSRLCEGDVPVNAREEQEAIQFLQRL